MIFNLKKQKFTKQQNINICGENANEMKEWWGENYWENTTWKMKMLKKMQDEHKIFCIKKKKHTRAREELMRPIMLLFVVSLFN